MNINTTYSYTISKEELTTTIVDYLKNKYRENVNGDVDILPIMELGKIPFGCVDDMVSDVFTGIKVNVTSNSNVMVK